MSRNRAPDRAPGGVPPELLDLGSPVWRDLALYSAWCRREGVREPSGATLAERFQRARDRWAVANGYTTGTSGQVVDHIRLIDELHVPWCGSLTRHMARCEADSDDPVAFRESCKLAPYGPVADRLPRSDPLRPRS